MTHNTIQDSVKSQRKIIRHNGYCDIPGCQDQAIYWDAANFAYCLKHSKQED